MPLNKNIHNKIFFSSQPKSTMYWHIMEDNCNYKEGDSGELQVSLSVPRLFSDSTGMEGVNGAGGRGCAPGFGMQDTLERIPAQASH